MELILDNRCGEALPTDDYLALAGFVLTAESASAAVELSISLVDSDEMQALNRQYRGIDSPTDVLSFENDGELLGDVVICPKLAREHARDFDSSFANEMALMLTHGILHLLGYDHIDDAEAAIMEARENQLLELWQQQAGPNPGANQKPDLESGKQQ